jgi:hypothetical protein
MQDNTTFGKSVPSRQQRFSTKDAGKQDRLNGIHLPNMIPASFDPEILKNPHKDNTIFQNDPMILQRAFMVSPCKEDDVPSQMFAHSSGKHGIYAQPYTAIPPDPLSKLAINLHDRMGPLGLVDWAQRPFYQASMY